jgi:hypothetical protein
MRRFLVVALALVVGAVAVAPFAATPAAQAQSAQVTVTPARGTDATTFTFVGTGFPAGAEVEDFYLSPSGEQFRFRNDISIADAGGSFAFDFKGADITVADYGTWIARFSWGDQFIDVRFDINP